MIYPRNPETFGSATKQHEGDLGRLKRERGLMKSQDANQTQL